MVFEVQPKLQLVTAIIGMSITAVRQSQLYAELRANIVLVTVREVIHRFSIELLADNKNVYYTK